MASATGGPMGSGGGFGLTDILTTLKNGVTALSSIASAIKAVFPQASGAATTATAGTAGAPPSQVAGYLNVQINGEAVKVPYYLP